MMKHIDLNCDMGEGIANDEAIMPWITSANIACGFHAGNGDTMRRTIDLAVEYGVHVGAHPSFKDRENFGRKEMHLPQDKLYTIMMEQLIRIELLVKERGAVLHHVKPHGALYNMAAADPEVAQVIVQAVKDFREDLTIYGLSGSHLVRMANELGLPVANEVFADRTYSANGQLTPRSQPNALIENEQACLAQVSEMIGHGTVTAITGEKLPIKADTVCIHSDGKMVIAFAKKLRRLL